MRFFRSTAPLKRPSRTTTRPLRLKKKPSRPRTIPLNATTRTSRPTSPLKPRAPMSSPHPEQENTVQENNRMVNLSNGGTVFHVRLDKPSNTGKPKGDYFVVSLPNLDDSTLIMSRADIKQWSEMTEDDLHNLSHCGGP